jgi:small conductance mechanosensitive channel
MEFLAHLNHFFSDRRLAANLIAAHGLITVTILLSLMLRRLIRSAEVRLGSPSEAKGWFAAAGEEAARRSRSLVFWLTTLVILGIVGLSFAYHILGADIREHMLGIYDKFTIEELTVIGRHAATLAGICAGVFVASRVLRAAWPLLELAAGGLIERSGKSDALRSWFGLARWYATSALCLLGAWLACLSMQWPMAARACEFVFTVLTIAVAARLLTLTFRVVTRILAETGDHYVGQGPFLLYWERLVRLIPFGERCFDAAVYVSGATLVVDVMHFLPGVALYGPRIVSCIGIFFSTRVAIELVQVLLRDAFGLNGDIEHVDQKAQTLVPLLSSLCQYLLYFGSALLMWQELGHNITPILAAASVVGLAVGLGAQNLVTDVVSGFFILFENQYMVGDFVQIGDAVGTVEEVGIRVTQVRDAYGKLYIIPNGQVKGVVSYSKGFVNAVVDMKVPSGSDLEGLFRAMTEAGKRLRQAHSEVLTETRIQGLLDLGTSDMTVRAITKVKPGTHWAMQNEYRKILKQIFDEKPITAARPALAA